MPPSLWMARFLPHRRLLINNYLLFLGLFFMLTFVRTTYLKVSDPLSPDNQDSIASARLLKDLQPFHYPVVCQKLFENDTDEIQHATHLLHHSKPFPIIPDEYYNISSVQCNAYRSERFNQSYHRQDADTNRQFSLAFSIVMHENVEQLERLLRLIYRPQNFYCIHVDRRANESVLEGVRAIAQCFDNVFLASKREKVLYATFSRLQADLNCMQDLTQYPAWKYVLNLANTELPLRTNSELVKILSMYRGFNDIEGIWKRRNSVRFHFVHRLVNSTVGPHGRYLKKTKEKKKPPPHNLFIVKGSVYGAFSRAFVEFVQTSPIAKELLEWSRDTYSPDEHYWATLNHNTHIHAPGGHKARSDPAKWNSRFANWGEFKCHGRVVRGICAFGVGDLPLLFSRHEFVANKFYLDVDPIAYQCIEQLLVNRSQLELPLPQAQIFRQMPFLLSP